MSTPKDWVWGSLNNDHLAHAAAAARRLVQNVQEKNLRQRGFSLTDDEYLQKRVGMEGEVAFAVLTHRRIRTVKEMTSTWSGPDDDGYGIKAIRNPHGSLLFQTRNLDESPLTKALVLVLNQSPHFAIIGVIDRARALQVRRWNAKLSKKAAWEIYQSELDPWKVQP